MNAFTIQSRGINHAVLNAATSILCMAALTLLGCSTENDDRSDANTINPNVDAGFSIGEFSESSSEASVDFPISVDRHAPQPEGPINVATRSKSTYLGNNVDVDAIRNGGAIVTLKDGQKISISLETSPYGNGEMFEIRARDQEGYTVGTFDGTLTEYVNADGETIDVIYLGRLHSREDAPRGTGTAIQETLFATVQNGPNEKIVITSYEEDNLINLRNYSEHMKGLTGLHGINEEQGLYFTFSGRAYAWERMDILFINYKDNGSVEVAIATSGIPGERVRAPFGPLYEELLKTYDPISKGPNEEGQRIFAAAVTYEKQAGLSYDRKVTHYDPDLPVETVIPNGFSIRSRVGAAIRGSEPGAGLVAEASVQLITGNNALSSVAGESTEFIVENINFIAPEAGVLASQYPRSLTVIRSGAVLGAQGAAAFGAGYVTGYLINEESDDAIPKALAVPISYLLGGAGAAEQQRIANGDFSKEERIYYKSSEEDPDRFTVIEPGYGAPTPVVEPIHTPRGF